MNFGLHRPQSPIIILGLLMFAAEWALGAMATMTAALIAWRRRDPFWAYATGGGLAAVALAAMHVRFAAYADALAALALPVAAAEARGSIGRVGVIAAFLALPMITPAEAAPAAAAYGCEPVDIAPALRTIPGAVVLTGVSDTPELLWRAPIRTVGSLYHRSIGAFARARDAWRSGPSDVVPDSVRLTGAAYILACEGRSRSALVSDLAPDTLEDRLARGEIPVWLHERAEAGPYRLYQIAAPSVSHSAPAAPSVAAPSIAAPSIRAPSVSAPSIPAPSIAAPSISPPAVSPPSINPPAISPPSISPPSINPPAINPPSISPPSIAPPSIVPPSINPPATSPPAVVPPTVQPQSINPPAINPPAISPPSIAPPSPQPPSPEPSSTNPPQMPPMPPLPPMPAMPPIASPPPMPPMPAMPPITPPPPMPAMPPVAPPPPMPPMTTPSIEPAPSTPPGT